MNPNAEPLELLVLLMAMLSTPITLARLMQAWQVRQAAVRTGRCEAVCLLAWIRVRNAGRDLGLSLLALMVGLLTVTAAPPVSPTPYRLVYHAGWAVLIAWTLLTSIANARDARRVVEIIERERTVEEGV